MPPPSSRMTKQPPKPLRYRPGKAEVESESEDESSENEEEQPQPKAPPPAATSFPSREKSTAELNKLKPSARGPVNVTTAENDGLEGFVTASESSEGEENDSESEEQDGSSSEEEESSQDEAQSRPMLRPTFISKAKRNEKFSTAPTVDSVADEERKRQEKADELLQAQLEREEAARAAGRKAWDDDAEIAPEDGVDDTDGLDVEAETAAWRLRELRRVRRDRLAIEEKEQEREEIERRRNLTAEEREAEDQAFIEAQKEERDGRGKMAFLQKYHHKGAFFQNDEEQDEEVKAALNRDFAGARFVDEAGDKAVLPEYMRIRDMTRLGRKGRSKYKDLRSEDTGQWGDSGRKRRQDDDVDDRFRADDPRDSRAERTGANNAPLGARDDKRPRLE